MKISRSKSRKAASHELIHHHLCEKSSRNLALAAGLNLTFSVVEFFAGLAFNSKMLVADAVHDLGDGLVLSSILIINKLAKKKPSPKFPFGFRRLVVIGAIINTTVILLGAYNLLRWIYFELTFPHKHNFMNVPGLFWISLVGIAVNLFATIKLHGSKNVLNHSVFAHMIEDLLGWILTLLTTILIWFTGFHQLDQAVTVLILLVVSWNALANVGRIFIVLMNGAPDEKSAKALRAEIQAMEGVEKIHTLHYWTLDGEQNICSAKIQASSNQNPEVLRQNIKQLLLKYNVIDSTVEILLAE